MSVIWQHLQLRGRAHYNTIIEVDRHLFNTTLHEIGVGGLDPNIIMTTAYKGAKLNEQLASAMQMVPPAQLPCSTSRKSHSS